VQVSGSEKFSVKKDGVGYFAGNVGIGTTSPDNRLQVSYTSTAPSLSSSAGAGLSLLGSSTLRVNIGSDPSSPYGGWVQSSNGSGASFPLNLNPLGGNVGIGTSSPAYKLDVSGAINIAAGNYFRSGSAFLMASDGSTTNYAYTGSSQLVWRNGADSAELMRLTNTGSVGIGTSSPGAKLDVNGGDIYVRTSGRVLTDTVQGYTGLSTPLALSAAQTVTISTASSERMRIDASGNVGIGTTTPSTPLGAAKGLVINGGAAGTQLRLQNTGSGVNESSGFLCAIDSGGTTGYLWNYENGPLLFGTNNAERMRIHSAGQVSIGTTTTPGAFSVSANGTDVALVSGIAGAAYFGVAGAKPIVFESNATQRMRIDSSGYLLVNRTSRSSSVAGVRVETEGRYGSTVTGSAGYSFGTNGTSFTINDYSNGSSEVERMRIDSSGNVGIANAIPSTFNTVNGAGNLVVGSGSGAEGITVYSGTTSNGALCFADGITSTDTYKGYVQYNHSTDSMQFATVSTERMRIDSSGNLLVGTTSAGGAAGLSIQPNSSAGATNVLWNRAGTSSTTYAASFRNGGTDVGTISYDSVATSYNTSSDARLKDNIADAEDAANLIDAIQVRKFDWKADGSHQRYGMVAQELVEVAPEAVSVPQDEDEMMGVDYSKLVPMLVKEIQSLRARVAQLEG